ncbi:MAG: helix-turn-helix domain-containing protein [Armatimonadota bacterium]|nr:helix-turn-helix domain-containing protein [Armatimonadota bacterium]
MADEFPDLFTIEQAANYLKVSQSSIRSYIRQGRVNAYRVAGKRKVLIPGAELMKLLVPVHKEEDKEIG